MRRVWRLLGSLHGVRPHKESSGRARRRGPSEGVRVRGVWSSQDVVRNSHHRNIESPKKGSNNGLAAQVSMQRHAP